MRSTDVAPAPDQLLEQLRAAYARSCDALRAKDLETALVHVTGTYREITASGAELARSEVEARCRLAFAEADTIGPAQVDIESIERTGDRVAVTARRLVFRIAPLWLDPSRSSETFEDEHILDHWRLVDGTWHLEETRHLAASRWGTLESAADPIESPRIAALAAAIAAGEDGALDVFWADLEGNAPLVEPDPSDATHVFVTFVWRGDREAWQVAVRGGLPAHPEDKPLARLGSTDLWYRTERMPSGARDSYAFIVQGTMSEPRAARYKAEVADTRNPRLVGSLSWFELPGAPPQPYVVERPGVPRGVLARDHILSVLLGEERPYAVHLPAGFDPAAGPGLLVVFDGEAYGSGSDAVVPTPRIVDNLVAEGRIPPIAVLLVDSLGEKRARDLPCHPPFFEFLTTELVPHVRDRYGLSADPRLTVAAGASFGGLAATYCGLRHSDVFGNVISQSGSFWYEPDWRSSTLAPHREGPGWMMTAFAEVPRLPVRFWMEVGRFEAPRMVLNNRHLRSILELKGYDVTYSEFDGGHSYACWRGSLADGLIGLVGGGRPGPAAT